MTKKSMNAKKSNVRAMVRGILASKQELKRSNTVTTLTAFATAGAIIPISEFIPQGDTIQSRSGEVIAPTSLKMVLAITAGAISFHGRMIIFQDMHNVGVTPTVAQVLDGGSFISTYFPETAQQRRFKILHDHVYSCVTATHTAKTSRELIIKLGGKIYYNGAAIAAASDGPGAVFVLMISDAASGAATGYTFYTTITYTDS